MWDSVGTASSLKNPSDRPDIVAPTVFLRIKTGTGYLYNKHRNVDESKKVLSASRSRPELLLFVFCFRSTGHRDFDVFFCCEKKKVLGFTDEVYDTRLLFVTATGGSVLGDEKKTFPKNIDDFLTRYGLLTNTLLGLLQPNRLFYFRSDAKLKPVARNKSYFRKRQKFKR